jgi:hypothetical protein
MGAPRFPKTLAGDGATKAFSLGFPVIAEAHIRVTVDGTLKVRGTDYNVQDPTAKNPVIAFAAAPANAAVIKFYRNTPLTPDTTKTLVIGPTEALYAQYRAEENSDRMVYQDVDSNETDTLAGTAASFVAPCDGYIESLRTEVNKAVTTGGNVTVEVAGVAVTGLSIAIADAAAIGTIQSDTPTTPQDASTKVRRGQVVTVTPAASFATAGAYKGRVGIQPADLD